MPVVWNVPVAAASGRGRYRGACRRGSSRGRDSRDGRDAAASGPGGWRSSAAARADAIARGAASSVGGPVLGLWRAASSRRPVLHDMRDDGRRLTGRRLTG
jgi:hypothetical protein